jgi:hypothetical protein
MSVDANKAPGGFRGKINIYTCEKCRGHIVTRDRDDGVTPFMIGCRATLGCKGMMKSSFYNVFDQDMAEGWEWYRPTHAEALTPAEREHVSKGGLLLRRYDQREMPE